MHCHEEIFMKQDLTIEELLRENERLQNALQQCKNQNVAAKQWTADDAKLVSAILDGVCQPLVLLNDDFDVKMGNAAFFSETKLPSSKVIQQNIFSFLPLSEFKDCFEEVKTTGKTWKQRGLSLQTFLPFAGKTFDCSLSVLPNSTLAGQLYLLELTNTTDNEKQKCNLRAAKILAEEKNRLKSAFLANVSHDIRTPLSGIVSYASMMTEAWVDTNKRSEYIDVINQSSAKLLHTIDSIIEISEIQANRVAAQTKEIAINMLLHDVYLDFYELATERNVDLKLSKTLASRKRTVVTDKQKIRVILSNLIKNALKFTENGLVEFGVEEKENSFEYYVKDTGIGIAPEEQARIFDYFHNDQHFGISNSDGVGLGLAISKGYVELLGGEIWLESAVEKGTKITFSLPK